MKKLLLIVLLTLSFNAHAMQAVWTGRMITIQTISYQSAVQCQYNANGQVFWQTFAGFSCPYSIEVY